MQIQIQPQQTVSPIPKGSEPKTASQSEQPKNEQVKAQPKVDTVEISANDYKVKTKAVETKQIQDKVAEQQTTQMAVTELKGHAESLQALSAKHQESNGEEKKQIEQDAKDVLTQMQSVTQAMSQSGQKELEANDFTLPSKVQEVDMNEFLKSENVTKQLEKPLEKTKVTLDTTVQQLASTLNVQTTTKMDIQQSLQKTKETLKDTDVNKLSRSLDSRRVHVSELLK